VGERVASWFAIALMAAVLGTSYWYAQYLRATLDSGAGSIGTVDFFAEGVALTGFDAMGRPHYRLFADHMTHFGNTDDVDLVQPRLVSMRPDQPRVQATAHQAHGHDNGQSLEMVGDVVLTRAADPGRPELRLQTETLSAVPDDDHFWTDAPVVVTSGGNVLHAVGLDYDNVARRVELHHAVNGVFPPRGAR